MIRKFTTTRGLALALVVGIIAGGSASCVDSDDRDLPIDTVEQHADDQVAPTKCYDFTKGVGGSDIWKLGVDDIDKWVICYTPRKGTLSYGDGVKCDTLQVTVTIRAYRKTGEKDGKPIYTLFFTNGPGTVLTLPVCSDETGFEAIVKLLAALKKIGFTWTEMKKGAPGDPNRVTWKPGDEGADEFMKDLIKIILRNTRRGKPTKTWEQKPKTKEVPDKMGFNDFNRLDTWPVGVAELEVTGTDVWLCADGPTPSETVLFTAVEADCAPPLDAEANLFAVGPDVVDTIGALHLETVEVGLDVIDELDEAALDGRLQHLYELLYAIDPDEFHDDDNLPGDDEPGETTEIPTAHPGQE